MKEIKSGWRSRDW